MAIENNGFGPVHQDKVLLEEVNTETRLLAALLGAKDIERCRDLFDALENPEKDTIKTNVGEENL